MQNMQNDIISAIDSFFLDFPREIGWKGLLKNGKTFFTRNRYSKNAEEMTEKLLDIKYDFFTSVYSFEDDFQTGKPWNRDKAVLNRLFLDFDSKENPAIALKEVKKLINKLSAKPLVVFSGSKGFHVHIVFRRTNASPESIRKFALMLLEKQKLKTCDPQVFEIARLCRTPFSIHSATNLKCTIIDAERIKKMYFDDVLRFVKSNWDMPDYELDDEIVDAIEQIEIISQIEKHEFPPYSVHADQISLQKTQNGTNMEKRLEMYIETLKRFGALSVNPRIREIHIKNKWVAENAKKGAVEHIARVYLVLMLIEKGYSDEEIHSILRFAKDYDAKKTQYYIDYNRKWLEKKRKEAV